MSRCSRKKPDSPSSAISASSSLEAPGGLVPQRVPRRVARLEAGAGDLGERAIAVVVLGAGVAVAEVVREVERQRLGEPGGLRDRVGMVREARGHRRGRGQDVRVVAAPQRLGRVERRVLAHGDERVLQARAHRRVRVDVAGRHAGHAQALRERGEAAVQRAVVAGERPLELHPERVTAERREQAAHRRLVADAAAGAAAQADEALRVLLDVGERHRRRAERAARVRLPRVRPRAREQPAEAASSRARRGRAASGGGRPDRHAGPSSTVSSAPWIARRPACRAACANSIEPLTVSWSVSASAVCPLGPPP